MFLFYKHEHLQILHKQVRQTKFIHSLKDMHVPLFVDEMCKNKQTFKKSLQKIKQQ